VPACLRPPTFPVDELEVGGSFLAFRLQSEALKDWVRFAKASPVLTASALAAFEGARLVRHRSRR